MDKRAITFVVLSTVIIFSWMSIQAFLNPAPEKVQPEQEIAQNEDDAEAKPDTDSTDTEQEANPENQETEDKTDSQATESTPSDIPEGDQQTGDSDVADDEPERAAEPFKLVTLGSLAADSDTRMLVTFNSRNGTVQRIELNERLPSGRFRYRDIIDRSGYLANLGLIEDSQGRGLKVRVVGPGTPAATATSASGDQQVGLQQGDIITQLDDTAVSTRDEYLAYMLTRKPGDELAVTLLRDGDPQIYNATLTARPMEVVRPDPTQLDRMEAAGRTDRAFDLRPQDPESLVINLGTIVNGNWSEFTPDILNDNWKTESVVIDGRPAIEFTYIIDFDRLEKNQGLKGKVEVVRRYQLAPLPEEERDDMFYRAYHLTMQLEIRNLHSEPQSIVYQLNGPTGASDEGWWYANKIHGRSTAVFYTAGSRDVIGGSEGQKFVFLGGPEIFSNEISKEPEQMDVFTRGQDERDREMRYLGVDSQYFNVSLLPFNDEGKNKYVVYSALARTAGPVTSKDKKFRKKSNTTFRIYSEPILLPAYDENQQSSQYAQDFVLFAGPKEPQLLQEYGLGDAVSYGWFAWFSVPLVWVLHGFFIVVRNYGIAIILLTIVVRASMTPISRKAVRNAQMMQHLQPEMKAIADKYKEDFEKRGRAQRELFRKYNYNPFGGCLLMFLQLPIFLGLYRALSVDIALRDQALIPGISWCANLAGPDQLFRWDTWMPSFIRG